MSSVLFSLSNHSLEQVCSKTEVKGSGGLHVIVRSSIGLLHYLLRVLGSDELC